MTDGLDVAHRAMEIAAAVACLVRQCHLRAMATLIQKSLAIS